MLAPSSSSFTDWLFSIFAPVVSPLLSRPLLHPLEQRFQRNGRILAPPLQVRIHHIAVQEDRHAAKRVDLRVFSVFVI